MSILKSIVFIFLLISVSNVSAQQNVTIVTPASKYAEDLDLYAVAELFKESSDLEEFEESLNDPDNGVNNLDLDENDEVDFIRVLEKVEGEIHIIFLQAILEDDEVLDIATIEVERSGDQYQMQITGHEHYYGPHYYIVPRPVHIVKWGIVGWMYRPGYKPYYSRYHYRFYPKWHRPYKPVVRKVYKTRTQRYKTRNGFSVSKKRNVKVIHNRQKNKPVKVIKRNNVKPNRKKEVSTERKTKVKRN